MAPKKFYSKSYLKNKKYSKKSKSNDKLYKKVNYLSKKMAQLKKTGFAKRDYENWGLVGPYQGFNLCDYYNMTPVFNTLNSELLQKKAIHNSVTIQGNIDLFNYINNEEEKIGFSMYVVSLRDIANDGTVWSAYGGALSLTPDTHYTFMNGSVLLNTKFFKIHYKKYFTLSNQGTALTQPAAQTQYGTNRHFSIKLKLNNMIENINATGDGTWKAMNTAKDPSKQFYLLVFTDNSAADGESPVITMSQLHKFTTL